MSVMIRIFVLILSLLFSNTIFSQAKDLTVYPIRVDHKWGYAKFYGTFVDTLIPPRYDYIGDVYLPWNVVGDQTDVSPFRLFEIDRKVGLLDNFLQESLPNKYKRIRPISKNLFAVEIDQGFQLINEKEEILFDGATYDDIRGERSDDQLDFFFVRKNRKWTVVNKAGEIISNNKYTAIESAGVSGYFRVKYKTNDYLWTLVDATGTPILSDSYRAVKVVSSGAIIVKAEGKSSWEYFLRKDKQSEFLKQPGTFKSIKKISSHLLALIPDDPASQSIRLQSLKGDFELIKELKITVIGGSLAEVVPDFYPVDENYAVQSFLNEDKDAIRYKLIDSLGEFHSDFFDEIRVTNKKGVYFVAKNTKIAGDIWQTWGVLQSTSSKNKPIKVQYSEIFDFEDDIAITQVGNSFGALAVVNNQLETLPPIFQNIYKSGKQTLQVQANEKAVIYELTPEGKFTEDLIVNNTIVFAENEKRNITEAVNRPLKTVREAEEEELESPFLHYDYKDGKLIILDGEKIVKKTGITEKIVDVKPFSEELVAIYLESKPVKNAATKRITQRPLTRIALFNIAENRIVNTFPFIGFRPFLSENNHTAFLDVNGKMGLIDRAGNQMVVNGKPLRYLYIRPFYAGRAGVCVGDKFYVDIKDQLEIPAKYNLGSVSEFLNEFGIMEVKSKDSSKNPLKKSSQIRNEKIYVVNQEGYSKWGYIDETGNLRIDPIYDFAGNFSEKNKRAYALTTLDQTNGLRLKTGFDLIDTNGKVLLETEKDVLDISYKEITEKKSFFQITVGKTPTFYFNQKGHQIFVNPTRMRPFSEGLALFRSPENKWGFVDSTGNILIEPVFKYARPFSDGLAFVVNESGVCCFINKRGEIAFETDFTEKQQMGLGDFYQGRCWFKSKKGWFWGCYDKTGSVVIEPKFYYEIVAGSLPGPGELYVLPMDFKKEVSSTQVLDENGKRSWTIIDLAGKKKTELGTYATIGSFDKNGIAVYDTFSKKEKGLLSQDGKQLCPPRYKHIKPFVNGYAPVQSAAGRWGLIDLSGKEILKPIYKEIGIAGEGLVPVKRNDQDWFFVDLDGKKVIPGPYQKVTPFQNGMSFVKREKKESLIDKSGNRIHIPSGKPVFISEGILGVLKNGHAKKRRHQYFYADESGNNILGRNFKEISPFQLGVAKVRILAEETPGGEKRRELLGAINKRGVMIVPPKFRNLHLQPDGNFVINPQRFFGLVSTSGKILLEPIYDSITYYREDEIFRAEQGEKVGYFTLKDNKIEWIWEMRY